MDFDVVIVGAGIAGLSCALTLQKTNLSFAILEAGGEAGGRIVLPAPLRKNLRACGEYQSLPGIQWALLSGRKTAEAIVGEMS